jgi:hypothetical protein
MVVAVVGVSWWGISEVVKIGTRYSENVERIKRGYPTLEGHTPKILSGPGSDVKDAGYIDMTRTDDYGHERRPGSN